MSNIASDDVKEPRGKVEIATADLIRKIVERPDGVEMLKRLLAEDQDLHIFLGEKFMELKSDNVERKKNAHKFAVLDTETTGTNTLKDKILQLSMVKVLYDKEGIIEITDDTFDQYQDPGIEIPEAVTDLTGITQEMVTGKKIDQEAVNAFIADCGFVLAHNAAFDRKILERELPNTTFNQKRFGCSIQDVDWQMRGEFSPKLELLLKHAGYVYGAHNAFSDIRATAFMLTQSFGGSKNVFDELIENLKKPSFMILAENMQFGRQDILKESDGPRWNWSNGIEAEAGVKAWWCMVRNTEQAFLAAEAVRKAYGTDVILRTREMNPYNMYSTRLPKIRSNSFSSSAPGNLFEISEPDEAPKVHRTASFAQRQKSMFDDDVAP